MNQLEIATQIFCSKRDLSYIEAYHVAGLLIGLDKPKGIDLDEANRKLDKALDDDSLTDKDEADLSKRTADRTQQLIDLGFEWNEEHQSFERGSVMVITSDIDSLCEEDWDYVLTEKEPTATVQEVKQMAVEPYEVTITDTDFFKGKPYIEFEMPNTTLRLYRMDNQLEAENDLQVTKSKESKYIMTHSENQEFELGFTIFKKIRHEILENTE